MNYEKLTNTEFINELMEGYNPHGVLSQMVVIQALEKGLRLMAEGKEELLAQHEQDEQDGNVSLIHIPSWVECTDDLLNKFNTKYNPSK